MKVSSQEKPDLQADRVHKILVAALLFLVSALVYLPFIGRFGYFNDDWYLMYAAGAKGAMVFRDIFSIDRPLRMLVMIPAYAIWGADPRFYNLGAFLFRLVSGWAFLWILHLLWPGNRRVNLSAALLFLTYPGFLSQPNAIDYLCHLSGLAAGMLSIALTITAVQSATWSGRAAFYALSIILGWFYLGQIEWYIGLEFFRFACLLLLAHRQAGSPWRKLVKFFHWASPAVLVPGAFLIWRIYYFKSERGATDVDLQFGGLRSSPAAYLLNAAANMWNDFIDVLLRAWIAPLNRLSNGMGGQEWMIGSGIAGLILLVVWMTLGWGRIPEPKGTLAGSGWKWEAILIGMGVILAGLLPVILVGRTVDFKSFSRYTLIASAGAALFLPAGIQLLSNSRLRNALFSILLGLASLTHYANGLARVRETEATRDFWWQVSWRIPHLDPGATLLAHYPLVVLEEDYFVWGPANLIYYPESTHADYPQPGVYAVVMNGDTVSKIIAREGQEFSNRRSIRTYPNYRNILVLTQPSTDSCVQVIDGSQLEMSSHEDERYIQVGPYSEMDQVLLEDSFHQPPAIPFGPEPERAWCYYYQKAALARQRGDWNEVVRLGEQAFGMDMFPSDQIEWMPFLQGYAVAGELGRMSEAADRVTDPAVREQACQILGGMSDLPAETRGRIKRQFCNN